MAAVFFEQSRRQFWGRNRPGFVYLLRRRDGIFKIGSSMNVEVRCATLHAGYGDLEIVHSFPAADRYTAERLLHRYLSHYCVRGEWYDLSEYLVNWIKRIEGFVGQYPF